MTTVIEYVADDGTVFEYEDDCLFYEFSLYVDKYKDDILLFNDNGERMGFTCDNLREQLERCHWLIVRTNEAAAFLYDEFSDITLPWRQNEKVNAGLWTFDENISCWISREELEQEFKIFNQIKGFL